MGSTDDRISWEPGTLSSGELDRILIDALADVWREAWRRDQPVSSQRRRFDERLNGAVRCATGQHPEFSVKAGS